MIVRLEIETNPDKSPDPPKITATPSKYDDLLEVLTAYKSVQQADLLHTLTFVTVDDYLWLLRAISQELSILGRNALYYLAAAVSDFFLPREKMVRHSFLSVGQLFSLCVYSPNTRFNLGKEAC